MVTHWNNSQQVIPLGHIPSRESISIVCLVENTKCHFHCLWFDQIGDRTQSTTERPYRGCRGHYLIYIYHAQSVTITTKVRISNPPVWRGWLNKTVLNLVCDKKFQRLVASLCLYLVSASATKHDYHDT